MDRLKALVTKDGEKKFNKNICGCKEDDCSSPAVSIKAIFFHRTMKPLVFLGGVTRTYGKVFVFWIRSFVGIGCLHAATLNLHRQLGLKIINKGRKISG